MASATSSCLQVPILNPCPDFLLWWNDLRAAIQNTSQFSHVASGHGADHSSRQALLKHSLEFTSQNTPLSSSCFGGTAYRRWALSPSVSETKPNAEDNGWRELSLLSHPAPWPCEQAHKLLHFRNAFYVINQTLRYKTGTRNSGKVQGGLHMLTRGQHFLLD